MNVRIQINKILLLSLVISFLLFVAHNLKGSEPIKVLFIGNSITLYHDLPQMFMEMANSNGKDVFTMNGAIGGTILDQHLLNEGTITKIFQYKWDYVILQLTGGVFGINDSEYSILKLDSLIHQNSRCTQTVLFIPWSLANNYTSSILTQALKYGNELNAMLIPAGPCWKEITNLRPNVQLYLDQIHPTITGTYIAACAVYSSIFKECSTEIEYYSTIEKTDALFYQETSSSIVLNGLDTYNLRCKAQFDCVINKLDVSFNKVTSNAKSYEWTFGDGESSDKNYPTHSYSDTGSYTIQLLVESNTCERTIDSLSKTIHIGELDKNQRIKIYQNALESVLNIEFNKAIYEVHISLYNLNSQKIISTIFTNTNFATLDLKTLANGIYILNIENKYDPNYSITKKIIKLQ